MRLALYALLLAACGDDDATGTPDGGGPGIDAAPPPMGFARAPARVNVYSNAAGGETWTELQATLASEAEPEGYGVATEEGSCRRLIPVQAFCDPACLDGVCVAGGTCQPWPTPLSAGTITIGAGGIMRQLLPPSYGQTELGLTIPAGERVSASAPGADYPAFDLAAPMSAPLDAEPVGLTIVVGEAVVFAWTPADPEARVRLELIADAGHARIHPSVIECDVADGDGRVTVPQAMVDAHADPANWSCGDCFSSYLTRYRAARGTTGAGDVDLWVGSRLSLYVTPH